ncbi:alcohol dehydrogenase catalytic domain-containing protein [Achromobacter xylosoxidans]|uniref:alcohol dehydrogenase n=1 Tax=Alcaligenes xylosoxydans xylosoxydans TaxID=85698 RepID=UPI0019088FD6|nr:alcohol dehydrogenase [Achromobacter xylosoxidans]MBK1979939.1 alcohol dehydrogenase catalytic domain-containing protein [Achromobacter xylosoxidans]
MKCYCVVNFREPLQQMDQATPAPQGSQVLLKVRAAGVCHSDIHLWEGGYDLGQGRTLSLKDRGVSLPLTMGHETVGSVVAAGPDARGVESGRNYLVYPWIGCGACPTCLSGQENHCTAPACLGVHRAGGYADHILVPHPRYLIDIGDLDPARIAPYACSGLTTYSALRKIGEAVYREHPVVIFGAGGLGLMSLTLIKALGGKGGIVVDIDPAKRQAALEAGALAAIDGAAPDAAQQIIKAAGGKPLQAAIDLVGAPSTTALAFDFLTKGGKLIIVGLFGGASSWPIALIPMKAMSIIGSYVGNLAELRELMDLVRTGKVPPMPVHRYPLDEADSVLASLRAGKVLGRAVLTVA